MSYLYGMSHTLSLAPFRGITNKHYRQALHKHIGGYDTYYAPFITGCGHQQIHPSKLDDLFPYNEVQERTVPQVLSNDAREITALAQALSNAGYKKLNWNLGCPFRRITHKKRGSGLLPFPGIIKNILENLFQDKVFAAGEIRLSVKTRTGYDSPDEITEVMEVFNAFPLHEIILHPRTGVQLYGGQAVPERYAAVKKQCRHPLIYNGDIMTRQAFLEVQEMLPGQRAWMLGRGALIKPFLAHEIKGVHTPEEKKRMMLQAFHQSLWGYAQNNIKGEMRQTGWMKAIWHYMSGIFTDSKNVFSDIKRSYTKEHFMTAVNKAFQQPFAKDQEISVHFQRLTR